MVKPNAWAVMALLHDVVIDLHSTILLFVSRAFRYAELRVAFCAATTKHESCFEAFRDNAHLSVWGTSYAICEQWRQHPHEETWKEVVLRQMAVLYDNMAA
jgi:hypothetical protein